MSRKSIPLKIQKKLLLLSGNACCFPECTEKLYNLEEEVLIGEMCHINSVNPQGARYEDSLQSEEIDSYDNLIMMCPTHHKIIDTNTEKYTIEFLKQLKNTHEQVYYKYSYASEGATDNVDPKTEKELNALERVLIAKENINLPAKKVYPKVPKHIDRYILPVLEEEGDAIEPKSLIDIISKQNRITILGVAGTGKTFELDKLANYYSEQGNEFYPIKIRLNLISKGHLSNHLREEYPNFDNIPENKLLILLDALDEVHSDYIDLVTNNIGLLGKSYPKSKIIVSCRNNLFITETLNRSSKIEGFKTYLLNPLTNEDVIKYIDENVKSNEDFNKKIEKFGLFDLLESPFYLVNLVEYYNKRKDIPKNKKEIFEYLIKGRFERDLDKYKTSGFKIFYYQNKIKSVIETLAFTAQCLGRNYLYEQEEFHVIVPEPQILEIVNHTFMFNKTHTDTWMFEHNNFQEYLAAKHLSQLNFQLIQQVISFPDNKKIKPFWVNTVSFLFSILDNKSQTFNELFNWINNIESDIFIRFERDKLELNTREVIFNKIFLNYEAKNIRIGNEKFGSVDLAKFVSDSSKILEFLIEKSSTDKDHTSLTEKMQLFSHFDNVNNYKDQIAKVLISKISDKDISNKTKYYCLREMATLKISSKEYSEIIIANINFEKSPYARAGFYSYIIDSDNYEDYINLYVKGVDFVNSSERVVSGSYDHNNEENVNLYDEKYTLEKILEKITNADNVKLLLKSLNIYEGHSTFDVSLIKQLLVKAITLYKNGHKDIFGIVLDVLICFNHHHDKHLDNEFREFFEKTFTTDEAFEIYYSKLRDENNTTYETLSALASLCNDEILTRLILDAETGKLSESQILELRHVFNFNRHTNHFDKFYDAICKINEKFKYPENTYETRKLERAKRDLELLFDRTEFIKEVEGVFAIVNKTHITREELFEYRSNKFSDLNNNIVLETLRNWSREPQGSIELTETVKNIQDDKNWLWFRLHKLISYDIHDSNYQFSDIEIKFITDWVLDAIKVANFSTAIELKDKDKDSYSYRNAELFIVYFTERLNIQVTEEEYLNFIYVDCDLIPFKVSEDKKKENRLIADFIIEKVGFEKTKSKVLSNMTLPNLYRGVRQNYFNFCSKYKVHESIDLALSEIQNGDLSWSDKINVIDLYFQLGGNSIQLEKALDTVHVDLKSYLINKLIEFKSPNINDYCLSELSKHPDTEIEIEYIQYLLKIDSISTFSYLKNWILKNKKIPNVNFHPLSKSNYEDLIEIYADCIKNNYGNDIWGNNKDAYLAQIIEISSTSEELYLMTKKNFEVWAETFDNSKYLYYQIQRLDQAYYSKIQQGMTFTEVKKLLSSPQIKKVSKIVNFWNTYKIQIEIVLAILGVIGFIISVITLR